MMRGRWRHHYPMSRLASWRVGGPAREFFEPADLAALSDFCRHDERAAKTLFVGHGSNLLVRDGGIDGVVARIPPGVSEMRLQEGGVYVEAGVGCPKLARFAAAAGFADAAFLVGVPGTVGGALNMNAGCHGDEIWRHVTRVLVLEKGGSVERRADDFDIGYRRVRAKNGKAPIFAAAWLHFAPPTSATAARARVQAMLQARKQTQPIGAASCGSVFCNPPGQAAGFLIESCGLKGHAVGGAVVSAKHANFIINTGPATAADIEQLILLTQQVVADKTGILLQPEVSIVGQEEKYDG